MPKKVIQYLPYSYHIHAGGLEKISQTISDGLNTFEDIQVNNVASDVGRLAGKLLEQYNDTTFVPSFNLVYNFPFPKFWTEKFRQHFRDIKYNKPNIIVTHTRFFVQSMMGGVIAKWLGCKRVHVEHGSGFVTGYSRYIKLCAWLFDRTIGLRIFRQCDIIVTISFMHKQFIKKFTKKDPIVIYNPIDYTPKTRIKNIIPHIGFVGRLVPLKGVNLLIDALSAIQKENRTCTLVGDGSEKERLEQQVRRLGLVDRIKFVGADDRAKRLHTFDIFVNPSYQEGVPTTVIEALMAGCTVVATDVGGTREISKEKDLVVIERGSVSSLQNGLEYAIQNYKKLGGMSNKYIKVKFNLEKSVDRYYEVYKIF